MRETKVLKLKNKQTETNYYVLQKTLNHFQQYASLLNAYKSKSCYFASSFLMSIRDIAEPIKYGNKEICYNFLAFKTNLFKIV